MSHRAVAIDGPAASGKSTIAKKLAEKLDLLMVNSGAMYRAVTWQILQEKIDPNDTAAVIQSLTDMEIIGGAEDGHSTITINGRLLDDELRSPEVNNAVSLVAAILEVRECLVALQREYLKSCDLVMEGRDIGSVVFPDTPFKLYITASEEVRASRRAADGENDAVAERDKRDSARKTSPLVVAEGAITIDSSDLDVPQTVEAAHQALLTLGWQ